MIKTINQFIKEYGPMITLFLVFIMFFRTCNISSKVQNMKTKLDSINVVQRNIYTREELDIRLEINGIETSKRTLYDWNSIVRTAVRPDDRMNEYDKELKKLKDKLK